MSPRTINPNPDRRYRQREGRISRDKERYLESIRHHPMKMPDPHPVRQAWKKRQNPGPWHTTHSHAHEEALGPHTNQPGPIRFPVKITINGRKN
ncbi:hypothetical protein ACKUB1_03625 [Methanospirillum stamsii]|uniref:Uncharacterized protein n=1 Tax=Methanospirillum stamsii TaxID=1277351 RepID=A0A2V2MNV2_9EURY|nr:hypothetical protein [Methanospirillum stamsii]PWR69782.1 hypothetical protein DLD82_16935 [Methanospirillum stamsii]